MKITTEKRQVVFNEHKIEFNFSYKSVKNINLRIKSNGEVFVSANRRVPLKVVDSFVASKGGFILSAMEKFSKREAKSPKIEYSDTEIYNMFYQIITEQLPLFKAYNIKEPQLKIRKMKARWGSCAYQTGIITLNKWLAQASKSAIEYVVVHELCHLIHPNHSKEFYNVLTLLMPDWKERKAELNNIHCE